MSRYIVTVVVDASVGIEVNAETPEEAAEMAIGRDRAQPTLCHSCSQGLDLGDAVGVVVERDAEEVYSSLPTDVLRHERNVLQKILAERQDEIDALAGQMQRLRERLGVCRHHACYSIGGADALALQLSVIRKIAAQALNESPETSLVQHDARIHAHEAELALDVIRNADSRESAVAALEKRAEHLRGLARGDGS